MVKARVCSSKVEPPPHKRLGAGSSPAMPTNDMDKQARDLMAGAEFADGVYRYSLWRFWNYNAAKNGEARAVMFIMGNPSTAGKYTDDPTTVKCAHYAQRWGYDGMYIGNLLARIDTQFQPWKYTEAEGVGPDNDYWLDVMKNSSSLHLAAWGFIGDYHKERALVVKAMFPELYCLELAKAGFPKHPLYLKTDLKPTLWER